MQIDGTTGYDVLNLGGALGTVLSSPEDHYEVVDFQRYGSTPDEPTTFGATLTWNF